MTLRVRVEQRKLGMECVGVREKSTTLMEEVEPTLAPLTGFGGDEKEDPSYLRRHLECSLRTTICQLLEPIIASSVTQVWYFAKGTYPRT